MENKNKGWIENKDNKLLDGWKTKTGWIENKDNKLLDGWKTNVFTSLNS